MNRTLVELGRTMQRASQLPEFLWELAIKHAAYIRNQSYSSVIKSTPYQIWKHQKPDVTHLQEFGVPVWTLLQGPHKEHKMLQKSKHCAFIGY